MTKVALRVLLDEADDGREVARSVLRRVEPVDGDRPGQGAAAEVRDEAVDGAQQRRLAAAGGADHEDELALGDLERHVVEGRERARRHSVTDTWSKVIIGPPLGVGGQPRGHRGQEQGRHHGERQGGQAVSGRRTMPGQPCAAAMTSTIAGDRPRRRGERLGPLPAVAPVARAPLARGADREARRREGRAHREQRQPEHPAGRRVEQAVESADHTEQADERERRRERSRAPPSHARPYPRLHRGGEAEGALEGGLEHRHGEASRLAQPGPVVPAQGARRPHRPRVRQQLRREGETDDDGGADVVERGGR